MPFSVKVLFTRIIPIFISFGILFYFCIQNNNFLVLLNVFPKLNFFYFFLSILSIIAYWILDSLVFKELIPDFSRSIFNYIKLTMYGQFYGSITPFSSGAQAAQLIILDSAGIDAGRSISIFSQKFFISQLCTVIISSFSIIFRSQKFKYQIPGFTFLTLLGLAIQCSGIFAVIVCHLNKKKLMSIIYHFFRFGKKIHLLNDYEKIYKKLENKLTFLMENDFSVNCGLLVYFYCFLQNISYCMVSFFISKSFGCPGFPIMDFIAAQTFINLLSIVNPLPGAAGTSEGSFLLLYKDFFDKNSLSSSMILFRLINYYLGILIGFFTVVLTKKPKK